MSTTPASDFLSFLRCPRCAGGLVAAAGCLACAACDDAYPCVDHIPWLLPEPERALETWRARQRLLLQHLDRQAAGYRSALASCGRTLTRNRLKLLAHACDDHARRLRALLAPLGAGDASAHVATYAALGAAAAPGGNLAGYYANIHRDWCWGSAENEATLHAVRRALGEAAPGTTLVLGAGAGRLAYDLHEHAGASTTVAVDVNPLLLFVARRLYAGERLELYEFPVAPRDLASHALLRTLSAPAPARPGLAVVFADVRQPPFAPGRFDTVVTPWLVDVVDADLAVLASIVNALLRPGGRWICTGTLYFESRDAARAYATEEAAQVVAEAGFTAPDFDERVVPYLASPASRHARHEQVVTFAVERVASVPQRRAEMPAWLEDPRLPVPLTDDVAQRTLALRVEGYVASLVDGRRSIDAIAARLVEERLLLPDEAGGIVRDYVARLVDEAAQPGKE